MEVARIVEAALRVVDNEGVDGLPMRSIAKELGSSTATLYRHFPTRAALINAVIDRVLAEVDTDPANYQSLDWRHGVEKLSRGIFEAFGRHRHATQLMADHMPIGPNTAEVRERMVASLMAGGFPVEVAAQASAMLAHVILGFAIQLGGERNAEVDGKTFGKALDELDLSKFPATAAVKKARWRPTTVYQEFVFALELVLDGLSRLRGPA